MLIDFLKTNLYFGTNIFRFNLQLLEKGMNHSILELAYNKSLPKTELTNVQSLSYNI